jgi:hypothetical protein
MGCVLHTFHIDDKKLILDHLTDLKEQFALIDENELHQVSTSLLLSTYCIHPEKGEGATLS